MFFSAMSKKDKHTLETLKRILNYLNGQGVAKGEFGRNAGFTIPHLNETEYLSDFQYPHEKSLLHHQR